MVSGVARMNYFLRPLLTLSLLTLSTLKPASAEVSKEDFPKVYIILESGEIDVYDTTFSLLSQLRFDLKWDSALLSEDGKAIYMAPKDISTTIWQLSLQDNTRNSFSLPFYSSFSGVKNQIPFTAALQFSPCGSIIYYSDIRLYYETPVKALVCADIKRNIFSRLEDISYTSRSRIRFDPSQQCFLSLSNPYVICDARTGSVIKKLNIFDSSKLIDSGDFWLHGAEVYWESSTISLWRTRLLQDGEKKTEQVKYDWSQDSLKICETPEPWPKQRFKLPQFLDRDSKSKILATLHVTPLDATPWPILTLQEAQALERLDNKWLANFRPYKSYISPKGELLVIVESSAGIAGIENLRDEERFCSLITVLNTLTGEIIKRLKVPASVTEVLFCEKLH